MLAACGSGGSIIEAQRSADGRLIRLAVRGCLADVTPVVDERPDVVRVGVRVRNQDRQSDCGSSTAVRLLEPLGDRPLIDAATGNVIDVRYDESVAIPHLSLTPIGAEETPDGRWDVFELGALGLRSGMGSEVSGSLLFVWGGLGEFDGRMSNTGAVVDLSTGSVDLVLAAPLDGRRDANVVWTGSEFIVFGGQDNERFFSDGAAYDPVSKTWRLLSPAPTAARAQTAATFASGAMYVLLPSQRAQGGVSWNSHPPFARYNPGSDDWERLAPPPGLVEATAALLTVDDDPVLVSLTVGLSAADPARFSAVAFNSAEAKWGDPVSTTHSASGGTVAVAGNTPIVSLTDGTNLALTESGWTEIASLTPACSSGIDSAGGNDLAYVVLCERLYVIDLEGIRSPQWPDVVHQTLTMSLCCGVIEVAVDDGLILVGRGGRGSVGEPGDRNILVLFMPHNR